MAVPNHRSIVEEVNRQYPHLLRHNTAAACAEFLQHVLAALPAAERWGLLSKSEGEAGYTYPNGVRCSYDYVAVPAGDRIDIIASAAGHDQGIIAGPAWAPAAPEEWRPSNTWVDTAGWPIFDSGTPVDGAAPAACTLAWGWFCWMTALAKWPAEEAENLAWILGEINPAVFRVLLCVEGQDHGSPDVWTDAGVTIDPGWEDRYKRMLDRVGELGRHVHCTLYGGRNYTPTEEDRRRFHDRIVAASAGRWGAIRSFECMNEFKANYWTAEEVRAAGRDLRAKLPAGFRLALSSPALAHGYTEAGTFPTNEEMAASFEELYGGTDHAGANEITIHTMRDGGKWSDPYAFNAFLPTLPKINNEPPGPGTSAGGQLTDATDVARDYQNTIGAGWAMYVGHAEWCVWNGHLPPEYHNGYRELRYVWELPHMEAIAEVLSAGAGAGGGGAPIPIEPPPPRTGLLPGEVLAPGDSLEVLEGRYVLENQWDGNCVLYAEDLAAGEYTPYWATGTEDPAATPGNLQLQQDGNLVLSRADGAPVWASHTAGCASPAVLQLQEDGNLVLYADGTPVWASGAPPAAPPLV